MSYESIKFGEFSQKSDVWSFGILMWEILSGGQKPFENVDANEFVNFLKNEGKPEFPVETPEQM